MAYYKEPYFAATDYRFPSFKGQGNIHPTPYDDHFGGTTTYSHMVIPSTSELIDQYSSTASSPAQPLESVTSPGAGINLNHLYHRIQQLEKDNEKNKKLLKVLGKRLNIIEQRLGIPAPPFDFNQ
ncbi:hypothetical protein JOD45_002723 [Scopulibacillus daqui]|uniref:Uncharacterized protein n=1 Tax=Scopulibacillus daqui TaxID=1469162 RepID=A0ABS2Q2Q3_9BACL|nr:hypothetical protein [Scopulibacillus daqui]MBM7646493.1 hypothetical protein [Scopulibacillus daqui]